MQRATLFLFLTLFATAGLQAHDPSKHKGKPVEGTVTSLSAESLELKTEKGVLLVKWTAETKFEHGEEAVTKEHLREGQQLAVFGTRLTGDRLVAKEILIVEDQAGHSGAGHHR